MTVDHSKYKSPSELAYHRQVESHSGWICDDYALSDTDKHRVIRGSDVQQNRVQRRIRACRCVYKAGHK
jgi:hypothetical protein